MPRKERRNGANESEEFRRILRSASGPDVGNLQKLLTFTTSQQLWISNSYTSIEQFLFKLINPTASTCALQSTEHQHFPRREPSLNQKLRLSALCFSSLGSLNGNTHKSRNCDFQNKLILSLCDHLVMALSLHGFPSASLSAVRNSLGTDVKPFTSISSVSKDKMPSPEYQHLVYTRIDYFTFVLRSMLEYPVCIETRIQLPLFMAFFHGLLSVNLTNIGRTSYELLLRSSQLLHLLACICRTMGSLVLPASSSLLTLVTYQLEWTSSWTTGVVNDNDNKKLLVKGLVHHRLAALNCLCELLPAIASFSSCRLPQLLPRLLDQVIKDIAHSTSLGTQQGVQSVQKSKALETSQPSTDLGHVHRILMANCMLVERIFVKPTYQSLFLNVQSSMNSDSRQTCSNMSDVTLRKELSRLEMCFFSFVKQITSHFPGGPPFRRQLWTGFYKLPEIHPLVLSSLTSALTSMLRVINSPSLRNLTLAFLSELACHPDSQLRLTVIHCQERLQTQPSLHLPVDNASIESVNQPEQYCTQLVMTAESKETGEQTDLQTPSDSGQHVAAVPLETTLSWKRASQSLEETSDKQYSECISPKRQHLTNSVEDISQQPVVPMDTTDSSVADKGETVDECLKSFDPTFA